MQVFALGYTYQNKEEQSKISIWKVVLLMMLACVARVLGKIWLDETLLYDVIIATICHGILGFGIFYGVRWVVHKLKVPETKCVNYLDNISFYVYLTHCLFMKEPLPLLRCTSFLRTNIILVLLATFASAFVLYVVSTSLQKRLLKIE